MCRLVKFGIGDMEMSRFWLLFSLVCGMRLCNLLLNRILVVRLLSKGDCWLRLVGW